MAGTATPQDRQTTRQQRRRQAQQPASPADAPPQDGEAVQDADAGTPEPEVVEHTLAIGDDGGAGTGAELTDEQLAERAKEMQENDGREVEHAIDLRLEPPIDPRFDADFDRIIDDELPEPPVTVVLLNLGRHGGRRRMRLQHRPGCPGRQERVESSPVQSPSGRKGVMTRCVDCAEQTYTRIT